MRSCEQSQSIRSTMKRWRQAWYSVRLQTNTKKLTLNYRCPYYSLTPTSFAVWSNLQPIHCAFSFSFGWIAHLSQAVHSITNSLLYSVVVGTTNDSDRYFSAWLSCQRSLLNLYLSRTINSSLRWTFDSLRLILRYFLRTPPSATSFSSFHSIVRACETFESNSRIRLEITAGNSLSRHATSSLAFARSDTGGSWRGL